MMQAVVLNGPRNITIEAVEEPAIKAPTDVLLRLTSTAICGTDLHMYEGRLGGGERMVIGHEPLGVVERVGDANCLRLPGEPGDRFGHDFVLLADALPTAFHATQMVDIRNGDIVVIYGAGAIGLLTAMCAFARVAAQVFVVDAIAARLQKAGELGAVPIDMSKGHAADRILEQIARERSGIAWRGEEANLGATVCIDAIGFQARDPHDYAVEHPATAIDDLARIAPKGRLSIIGVFLDSDPHARSSEAKRGEYVIPWGVLFKKGVMSGMGRDDDENYNDHLRDMIVAGRMKPSTIVTQRLPRRDAADAFAKFDARSDGYIKVVLEP